jgi:hypothetical protein
MSVLIFLARSTAGLSERYSRIAAQANILAFPANKRADHP